MFLPFISILILPALVIAMENHQFNEQMRAYIYNNNLPRLQELFQSPETNNIVNKYNKALEVAALFDMDTIAQWLLESGANIESISQSERLTGRYETCEKNRTPLIVAAGTQEGSIKVVKLLLEKGANVNAIDANKETALFRAASMGHIEIMKLLLAKRSPVNTTNYNQSTPLIAFIRSYSQIPFPNYLQPEVKEKRLEMTKEILKETTNINYCDAYNNTAIHYAYSTRQLDICKLLKENKADPTIKNLSGNSPYSLAQTIKDKDLIEALS